MREQLEEIAKRARTPPAQRVGVAREKTPPQGRGRSPLQPLGWDTDSAAGGGFKHPSDLIVNEPADKSPSRSKSGSRGQGAKGKGKKKGKGKLRREGKKGKSKGKDKKVKQHQKDQFPRKDAQKGGGAQKGKGKNK